jgi:hypothetical protein
MRIMFSGQIMDIDETIEQMRKALVKVEAESFKDIGCDGVEAEEMAYEDVYILSEDTVIKKLKQLEIK